MLLVLAVYLGLCVGLLLPIAIAQALFRDPSSAWHQLYRPARIAFWVLCWYSISVAFTLFNKYMLVYWHGGFPFPITTTMVHMFCKFFLTRVLNLCRPLDKRFKTLPCSKSCSGPIPIGVATGIDVAFSNLSFMYITITFYTILKSGTLLWILAWAIVLGLEPLRWELFAICSIVSGGVGLASYGEASFSWIGFALVTAACCLSGLRWALTESMLEDEQHEPLGVLYHIAPASALSTVPVFVLVELRPLLRSPFLRSAPALAEVAGVVVAGGAISFLLILAEVKLVKISSSLTMGIFGNLKEVVTIALSMMVYGDAVSALNVLGLALAVAGAWLYKLYKLKPQQHVALAVAEPGGIWHLHEDDDREDVGL